jgi:hypothetical protein
LIDVLRISQFISHLQVFDYPSILELSEFLASTCPEAVTTPTAAPETTAAAAAAAVPDATATAVQLVSAAVAELLGSSAAAGISTDGPLMQAGVNSTLAVQLTGQLETTLGTSLPATLVRLVSCLIVTNLANDCNQYQAGSCRLLRVNAATAVGMNLSLASLTTHMLKHCLSGHYPGDTYTHIAVS